MDKQHEIIDSFVNSLKDLPYVETECKIVIHNGKIAGIYEKVGERIIKHK